MFEPIAIVGRACLLPGANTPEDLWDAVSLGRDLVTNVPAGRWGLSPEQALALPDGDSTDRAWSDRGGYVRGFESAFDPTGFAVPPAELDGLDPVFLWSLHTARGALVDAGDCGGDVDRPRVGAVFGNLGFPSAGMAAFAQSCWLQGSVDADPRNRFMGSGPARLLESALGLGAGVFCVDAACASSLYAIKLACDRLHERTADVMLAGAVQAADDLFLHIGFTALNALSRTGRTRPFHRDADGLVPAEGAGFVALKRLGDARADGDRIHGVIRAVGLSNDGRGKGILAPSQAGQELAMRRAYALADVVPADVSLLECHATGTPVGDATEVRSTAAVFAGHSDLAIGSLKSNMGHLITTAGVAGLIKVLEAIRHRQRPPTLHCDVENPALDGTPLRVLHEAEPWSAAGPRIAGVSAFGFGGNNAHLVVSEEDPSIEQRPATASEPTLIAVVGVAHGRDPDEVRLEMRGSKFPPKDLQQSLPQQLAVLAAAIEASGDIVLPSDATGVFVGIEPDCEVARYGTRWRMARIAAEGGHSDSWLATARDGVVPALTAAAVVGTMPNIPANRVSSQLDLHGPAFTLAHGVESGTTALRLSVRGLRSRELDAAIVGAADFSDETVHAAAAHATGVEGTPADGYAVLVLKRLPDALRDGDRVRACLEELDSPGPGDGVQPCRAYAAGRLVDVAVSLGADPAEVEQPRVHVVRGRDAAAVAAHLRAGRFGGDGPACLAFVATPETLADQQHRALAVLAGEVAPGAGVRFRSEPIEGDLAFVFGGAGAAYPGMGRALLAAWPSLANRLAPRSRRLAESLSRCWVDAAEPLSVLDSLWGASAVSQLHAVLLRDVAGVEPDAVIGYSSGESNSLLAMGIWNDADALIAESEASELFTRRIAGGFEAVAPQWGVPVNWETWVVLAPVGDVEPRVADEARLHVTIINSASSVVVAGEAAACGRIVGHFGADRCVRIPYDLAVHVPELTAVRADWLALHRRETTPQPVRVYSNGVGQAYEPSPDACATAILRQADRTLDFRPTVESAYADGARVFVELGPQGGCAAAIRQTLGDREALVLSLDSRVQGAASTHDALAALAAAGVPLDLDALYPARSAPSSGPTLSVPAHAAYVVVPPRSPVADRASPMPGPLHPAAQLMAPAPSLRSAMAPALPLVAVAAARSPVDAHLDEVALLQSAHFANQTQAQTWYLAYQQQALQVLLRAAGGLAVPTRPAQGAPLAPRASVQQADGASLAPRASVQRADGASLAPKAGAQQADSPPVAPVARGQHAADAPIVQTALARRTLSREQLETHASGRVSSIFGPEFAEQDAFDRQVRMPIGRLLLADRVTDIDAEPCSMGKGTIWTETDVCRDSWYLHEGRMPAGILIESGQADLMLISYLGIDRHNRGERVYRLLGCELTYHGDLPRVGDTLRYDIHVDNHAQHGDVRLMFFHYDCEVDGRPQLSVRQGQAGFFSDQELADSAGCLWSPDEQEIVADPRLDPPAVGRIPAALNDAELEAFAAGDLAACFGDAYGVARAHVRTPKIQGGDMRLLDRVTSLDPRGGPWCRGYLRAELDLSAERWFYDGHFLNDPCMPGTLMFEGCLQTMAVYLAAIGFTLSRDGWRFQPKPELPFRLSCRGQAIPSSELLTYELFVEEVVAGPVPTLYADLLCTVDGRRAFHARRVALELVPDWPLEARADLLDGVVDPVPVAESDGFRFGYASMLACAWGRPSDAFGPMYAPFDGPRRVPRLPGPPYHFMTRVTALEGPIGVMKPNAAATIEYDVPPDAWYFDENGCRTMPFAVLLEAALQPCGWLASYVGSALTVESELGFRNLDGTGTLVREVPPDTGTLVTKVKLTSVSATAGMIIQSFDVGCYACDELVYDMNTVFGFFPPAALADQAGLPVGDDHRELRSRASEFRVDLTDQPAPYWSAGRAQLADPMLLMLDRVTGYWPDGGEASLGQARGAKDVDQDEWFFKAHFFQDPVQPGSLGLEALLQLLQFTMLEKGMDAGFAAPRFEPVALGTPMTWKYRGQVLLHNALIESTIELTDAGVDDRGAYAMAAGSLWVDGKRIYEASGLGMRIVDSTPPFDRARSDETPWLSSSVSDREGIVDPSIDPWILDHCPTYTRPALPMMSALDRIASAVQPELSIIGLRDVRVRDWIVVDGPTRFVTARDGDSVTLLVVEGEDRREVASARVLTGAYADPPSALAPIEGEEAALPYVSGALFHGPAFEIMRSLTVGDSGSSSVLRADNAVPVGRLNPGLLDGATHGIPHDALHRWFSDICEEKVAYPALIPRVDFYGPTPTSGDVRCEVRVAGMLGSLPRFRIQLIGPAGVWAELTLVEACFDKGPLGSAEPEARRAFLRDRSWRPGVALSATDGDVTRLAAAVVEGSDWFPDTIRTVYGTRALEAIARREHAASAQRIHPSRVFESLPLNRFDFDAQPSDAGVVVRGDPAGRLDISSVRAFWSRWFDRGRWPVEDLYYGLIERFVDRVVLEDPDGFAAVGGRSVLYLANHETGVESLLFSIVASALGGVPTVTLAKAEHRHSWLGELIAHCFSYPGVADPKVMTFFDRDDKTSLRRIVDDLGREMATAGRSVMVHVEGTRALSAAHRVEKMTGAFIDMALAVEAPIVPVRFTGGLPLDGLDVRIEFPVGMGKQTIWFGSPILPEDLARSHYGARKARVIAAMNDLAGGRVVEPPHADPELARAADGWAGATGASPEHATLRCVLSELDAPTDQVTRLLASSSAADLDDGTAEGRWLAELGRRLLGSAGA